MSDSDAFATAREQLAAQGAESRADIVNDERIFDLLKPEHGMPLDVKLEARVSGIHRTAHP